eukprot:TRINITY_DN5986_c0_g1_i4.p1 TRINITY_DN5986_c0_g1~~TRINITY_DN5986_c0_g1_i4.p1  ORF type:complete len:248 (-),score=50.14 TRINITY_DN5986_c0_g1_i4:220-963(-)
MDQIRHCSPDIGGVVEATLLANGVRTICATLFISDEDVVALQDWQKTINSAEVIVVRSMDHDPWLDRHFLACCSAADASGQQPAETRMHWSAGELAAWAHPLLLASKTIDWTFYYILLVDQENVATGSVKVYSKTTQEVVQAIADKERANGRLTDVGPLSLFSDDPSKSVVTAFASNEIIDEGKVIYAQGHIRYIYYLLYFSRNGRIQPDVTHTHTHTHTHVFPSQNQMNCVRISTSVCLSSSRESR